VVVSTSLEDASYILITKQPETRSDKLVPFDILNMVIRGQEQTVSWDICYATIFLFSLFSFSFLVLFDSVEERTSGGVLMIGGEVDVSWMAVCWEEHRRWDGIT